MRSKLTTLTLAVMLVCSSLGLLAQKLKVVEDNGHLSPLMIKVLFTNDTSRTVMLRGIGDGYTNEFRTHTLGVRTDGGASERTIWLDSIATISGTSTMRTRESEFTVVLKDGKKIAAQLTGMRCKGEIDPKSDTFDCRVLYTHNDDDGDQKIDLQKVKSVEFLEPARKDKAGNALFDTWRYSPFTGEKVPE